MRTPYTDQVVISDDSDGKFCYVSNQLLNLLIFIIAEAVEGTGK